MSTRGSASSIDGSPITPSCTTIRACRSKSQISIAVSAMAKAEPVWLLPWSGKAEWRAFFTTFVFADVIFDPRPLARCRRHAFRKSGRFVAHSGLIGPTRAGWSFGCLLMSVELTSRPTRLNCNWPSMSWLRMSFRYSFGVAGSSQAS
jgi:hypothetical protein